MGEWSPWFSNISQGSFASSFLLQWKKLLLKRQNGAQRSKTLSLLGVQSHCSLALHIYVHMT